MSKLPKSVTTVSDVQKEASDVVGGLIEHNIELEAIFDSLQPLLYALSVKLYGENAETITLDKLITDSIAYLNIEDIKVKE